MLHSRLLSDSVQITADQQVLILNSASNPFVLKLAQQSGMKMITLAEDNMAALASLQAYHPRHIPFHEYTLHAPGATMDVAVMDLLYQPGNTWMQHGLHLAAYALKPGGRLYVVGAKDRGILSLAKHMRAQFGNLETLEISKGSRVVCSTRFPDMRENGHPDPSALIPVFAAGELDEGTRLLLEALEIRVTDRALDIGCGAGYIGLHIARHAHKGQVTMVDASLVAVATAQQMIHQSGLTNISVLPADGAKALLPQRFDLVVTNPPFHIGGIQTSEIAERFIREASQVLQPRGRFYLVANRFLKYEPVLNASFTNVIEVHGNSRFKVLKAEQRRTKPVSSVPDDGEEVIFSLDV